MSKPKYIKDPGYVYDIMFIPMLHHNREVWYDQFAIHEKAKEDVVYFENLLYEFPALQEVLSPFYYKKDGKRVMSYICESDNRKTIQTLKY